MRRSLTSSGVTTFARAMPFKPSALLAAKGERFAHLCFVAAPTLFRLWKEQTLRAVPGASLFHRKAVTTSKRSKHETMLLLRRGRGAWSAGNAGSAVDVYRTVARRRRLEAQPDGGLPRVQQHQG